MAKPTTTTSSRRPVWLAWAPAFACVILLAAIEARAYFEKPPKQAGAYLAHVHALAETMPKAFDHWIGRDVPLPLSAVHLLQPNVDFCRNFVNHQTGEQATLMVIDCSDTRNLSGHYPPNCYPGNGWILDKSTQKTWVINKTPITGMEYKFHRGAFDTESHIYVDDFFIMPDGKFLATEREFLHESGSFNERVFGAAQVELTLPGDMLPADRLQVFHDLIGANWKLISAILHGVSNESAK
ncbi:MAG: exosortase-associated EpsI family protein [Phycisphaerae bacterium]